MSISEQHFFNKKPEVLVLYEKLLKEMKKGLADFTVKVQKTQISFYNKHLFACVSLPVRKIKQFPENCLIVTFGLDFQLQNSRVFESTEPYPGRWTHHIVIQKISEVDTDLLSWIRDAYDFAMIK